LTLSSRDGIRCRVFLTMTMSQFHLAFPVRDLGEARSFYIGVLGYREGRST